MIILKRFALISLLFSLSFVAACTAEAEPSVGGDTAMASPTTEPTPITETVPTLESTATTVAEVAETAVPTEAVITDGLEIFFLSLYSALVDRNFDQLLSLMSDPVAFGYYRSEWQQQAPAEIRPLLENLLPTSANLQFSPADTDLTAMLDGQNPQTMLGPDVTVAAVWHTTGWGADGKGEAILFVAEEGDGRYALKAVLYAPFGFIPEFDDLPVQDEQSAPVGLLYSQPDGSLWQIAADGQPEQLWFEEGATFFLAPDGKHAYFQIQGDLWLLDIAAGETRVLTTDHDDQGTHLSGYHWWYDNNTILSGIILDWAAEEGPNLGYPALIDIATGEVTMLDDQHLMLSHPAIAADGAVAYSTVGQSADDTELTWVYRPGSGVTAFDPADFSDAPDGFYTSPGWSVDGRFLAWLVSDGVNVHIAVFDLESGSVANLPSFPAAAFGGPYPNPIFSEDPNWIALRQFYNDPAKNGLWLYTQDGQEPLFIAQNGGESFWLSDHQLLFIDYDENFNGELQQYDTLTGVRSAVTLPNVFQIFGIVE